MRQRERETSQNSPRGPRAEALPAGTPAWITLPLVRRTIEVWQPHYETPLTLDEAVRILSRVGRLFGVLMRDDHHEEIPRPGSGQQS